MVKLPQLGKASHLDSETSHEDVVRLIVLDKGVATFEMGRSGVSNEGSSDALDDDWSRSASSFKTHGSARLDADNDLLAKTSVEMKTIDEVSRRFQI